MTDLEKHINIMSGFAQDIDTLELIAKGFVGKAHLFTEREEKLFRDTVDLLASLKADLEAE